MPKKETKEKKNQRVFLQNYRIRLYCTEAATGGNFDTVDNISKNSLSNKDILVLNQTAELLNR